MRLIQLSFVLAGVGIATLQANASPLRVVVVTTKQEITSNGSPDYGVATIVRPVGHAGAATAHMVHGNPSGTGRRLKHFCGSLVNKASKQSAVVAAYFKETFGFAFATPFAPAPPVKNLHSAAGNGVFLPAGAVPSSAFYTLPTPTASRLAHLGPLISYASYAPVPGSRSSTVPVAFPIPSAIFVGEGYGRPGARVVPSKPFRTTFLERLNMALLSLGTWEGRIVAFVLGCGLGVLIRMIWVLSIVSFRSLRGSHPQETEGEDYYYEGVILFDGDQHETSPPQYTAPTTEIAVDEKKEEKVTGGN